MKTNALTEDEKQKWTVVMNMEMMSSEGSDAASGDDENICVFVKHPLAWRKDKVTSLFKSLDRKGQSKRSTHMTQQRILGTQSQHPRQSTVPDCPQAMTDYKLPSGHDSTLCSIFRKCIVVLLVLAKSMCIIPLITVILINVFGKENFVFIPLFLTVGTLHYPVAMCH